MFGLSDIQSKALIDWVKTELNIPVVASGQEGVVQERPFAVVSVVEGPKHENLQPTKVRKPGSIVEPVVLPSRDVIFYETFVASIRIRDNDDAMIYARALEHSIYKTAVKTALNTAGLFCRYCSHITSTDYKVSTRLEYLAIVSFKFACVSSFNEVRDVIEHVEITFKE